jgi:hypothetical protein
MLLASTAGQADESAKSQNSQVLAANTTCEQVISCGTKDGVRKEYPTPCDARDDGATDIQPKTGPTCEAKE